MNISKIANFLERRILNSIPFIIAVCFILFKIITEKTPLEINFVTKTEDFFISFLQKQSQINTLISICGILSGFYITSFSIILSNNKTMINLVKTKNGKILTDYFAGALITNFGTILLFLIVEIIPIWFKSSIVLLSLIYLFFYGFRFIIVVILIFDRNIDFIEEELKDKENRERIERIREIHK